MSKKSIYLLIQGAPCNFNCGYLVVFMKHDWQVMLRIKYLNSSSSSLASLAFSEVRRNLFFSCDKAGAITTAGSLSNKGLSLDDGRTGSSTSPKVWVRCCGIRCLNKKHCVVTQGQFEYFVARCFLTND